MKLLLVFPIFLMISAHADQEIFEAHKKNILENIDMRIQKLQDGKACISAATSKEQAKACHAQMKEAREGIKANRKANKEEMKALREKHKQEKKEQKTAEPTP